MDLHWHWLSVGCWAARLCRRERGRRNASGLGFSSFPFLFPMSFLLLCSPLPFFFSLHPVPCSVQHPIGAFHFRCPFPVRYVISSFFSKSPYLSAHLYVHLLEQSASHGLCIPARQECQGIFAIWPCRQFLSISVFLQHNQQRQCVRYVYLICRFMSVFITNQLVSHCICWLTFSIDWLSKVRLWYHLDSLLISKHSPSLQEQSMWLWWSSQMESTNPLPSMSDSANTGSSTISTR